MSEYVGDRGARGPRLLVVLRFSHVARFAQKFPGEKNIHETKRGSGDARSAKSKPQRRRSERRADRDANVGSGREPAKRLGAILRLDRVSDVRLDDADRSTARALHQPRQKQQPDRISERENDIRDSGSGQSDQQRGTTAILIGKTSPRR